MDISTDRSKLTGTMSKIVVTVPSRAENKAVIHIKRIMITTGSPLAALAALMAMY